MNTNTNTNTNNHAQNTETHVKSGARKAGGAVLVLFGILLLILLSQPDARMAGAASDPMRCVSRKTAVLHFRKIELDLWGFGCYDGGREKQFPI